MNYSHPTITEEEQIFLEDKELQGYWVERPGKSNKFGRMKVISNMTMYKEKIKVRKDVAKS